jgi:F0F1-type ATP synthase membrane subunit b/b'
MRGMAADLAIQAASKLISRNLDDASQRKLVDDYLSDLDRFPGDRGAKA